MKRRLTVALLTLAIVATSSALGSGCAYRRADRSIVQPLAMSKKQFTGEWYYMKTVYEAPFESGFFNGQGGWPLGAKIRWEITERFLYAFNASPNVRNTDSETTPMAAWPITRHFDIKPRINYSTGEPTNVIIEESFDGLPWYQRKYMRVMWQRMAMSDWTDIIATYYRWIGVQRMEAATYVPPQKVEMGEKYMTFVTDNIVTKLFSSYYNMVMLEIPMSSHRIRLRHAFRKVETSTYTPKEYNDQMFAKFGNFRNTVVRFHPERGIVDWSYKFYASRHNVAMRDELNTTNKPKQIVYYLSPNFPVELVNAVKKVQDGWNEAFAIGLQRQGDNVFVVRPNNWKEGVKECEGDITQTLATCTEDVTGVRRELGDLRYNYIWWVNAPQAGGLLGYGPSLSDPDTGEIVHGSAYIYGAPLRQIVDFYMTLYDMITGRYTDNDIINSLEYFNAAFGLNGNKALALPNGSTQKDIKLTVKGPKVLDMHLNSASKILGRLQSPAYLSRMMNIRKLTQSMITANIAKLDDHPQAKANLLNDHIIQLAFPGADAAQVLGSQDDRVKDILNRYHPANIMKPHKLREIVQEYLAPSKMNMFMANYYDDIALHSFFKYHAEKKTPRNELRQRILDFLFVSVTAHEVGHTLSLTHNFTGSTDEYNYHDAYHQLAKTGKISCTDTRKCPTDQQVPNTPDGITAVQRFYRNASIMDYAGEYYDDGLGVGKTDIAAISFIYGGLVEKAVDDPQKRGEMIKWSMDVERKNQNPNDPLKLRTFRFCSDYMVGQDPLCQRWDSGPTAVAIVERIIKSYDRTYLLRYWRRGRRSFGPSSAFYRNFFSFQHIASIYQDWVYRIITQPGYKKTKDFEDKLEAVQKGFNFYVRILGTPAVDQHSYDEVSKVWMTRPISEDPHKPKVDIPLGVGRFFFSTVQDGYYGIFRFRRIGTLYDKWLTLMSMSIRSWGYYNNDVNWIYTNFYDLFRQDTTDLFSQSIADVWNPNSKLLFKVEIDDGGKKVQAPVEPAWHPFLQYNSMVYALALLNNQLSDMTFQDNMRVGIIGSGKSWTPPGSKEVTCPDISTVTKHYKCDSAPVLCFMNAQRTRTYFAVQTQDTTGISWQMVKRGCELAQDLELLRRSTTDINRSAIERKENDLRLLETVLTYMQYYVSTFGG